MSAVVHKETELAQTLKEHIGVINPEAFNINFKSTALVPP